MVGQLFKSKRTIIGVLLLLFFLFISIFAPIIAPYDSYTLETPNLPPSSIHILGTNDIGQDIFSELLYGTRISLVVGFGAAILATFLGAFVALMAGYFRGFIDNILMVVTDFFLLVPSVPLIIVVAAYFRLSIWKLIIVIAFLGWASIARIVRSRVLQVREKAFVRSARTLGAGSFYIIFQHILPNSLNIILANASLAAARAIVIEAGMSFLGLGDPTQKSWGMMLHDAFSHGGVVNGYFWWYLPPIFCISLSVIGFTLLGYSFEGREDLFLPGGIKELKDYTTKPKSNEKIYYPENYLLLIKGLSVKFRNGDKIIRGLDKIDLGIKEGEKVAIIGETGSGKSILLLALLRLLPANSQISGKIYYKGKDLLEIRDNIMCQIRGNEIAYVPQGIGNVLNPVVKIGLQIAEPLQIHLGVNKGAALKRAIVLLNQVGIEKAAQRIFDYPHQYSGGMKKQVLVSMALAREADLILADEPTKGLDWNKRKKILEIFQNLDSKTILSVTHDLWFAEMFAQRIVVMYGSRIVEVAPQNTFFITPLHPYSQALLAAHASRGLKVITGNAPIRMEYIDKGCVFRPYCNKAFQKCLKEPPLFKHNGHEIRCWLYAS